MSEKPYIVVAGLARCGTSLTMQMLHAGGVPCIGEYPGFEVEELNHRKVDAGFLARHPGHAFKLLDPAQTPLPIGFPPGVVIWLDRDCKEQARSQAKFSTMLLPGLPPVTRAHLRRWAAALRQGRAPGIAPFADWRKLVWAFEDIIEDPQATAHAIAGLLAPWWPDLDWQRMAAQVLPRTPECAPGLDIEMALVEQAEQRA